MGSMVIITKDEEIANSLRRFFKILYNWDSFIFCSDIDINNEIFANTYDLQGIVVSCLDYPASKIQFINIRNNTRLSKLPLIFLLECYIDKNFQSLGDSRVLYTYGAGGINTSEIYFSLKKIFIIIEEKKQEINNIIGIDTDGKTWERYIKACIEDFERHHHR